MRAALAALALLLLAGCAADPGRASAPAPAPWPADWFPDIPVPPGWRLASDPPPAIAVIGGGAVRRADAVLEAVHDASPRDLLASLARSLPAAGWRAEDDGAWRKGDERLRLAAKAGGVHLRLGAAGP